MGRLTLIAIGLSALLWTVAIRPDTATPGDERALSAAPSCQVAADPDGPGDSENRWRAHQVGIAAVSASPWTSAPVHAALGSTRTPRCFDIALASSSPDPPAHVVPLHLLHTPLLI